MSILCDCVGFADTFRIIETMCLFSTISSYLSILHIIFLLSHFPFSLSQLVHIALPFEIAGKIANPSNIYELQHILHNTFGVQTHLI